MQKRTEEILSKGNINLSPILMRDKVLSNITKLNMDQLRKETGLPDQKIRSNYKFELLQQVNQLLMNHSKNEVSELTGFTTKAINTMIREYNLPDSKLGEFVRDINVNELAQQIGEKTQFVRNVSKVSILHRLNDLLNQSSDIKAAAKGCGITYDVARKLVKQYKLPFVETRVITPYSNKGTVSDNDIRYHASKSRKVQVGRDTRLISVSGVIIADDLLGKTADEIKNMGPFCAINEKNELVSCDILSAKVVHGPAVRIKSKLGADLVLGADTKLISDELSGLKGVAAKDGMDKRVMSNKSFERLSDTSYNFFDLLYGDDITFILKKDVGDRIVAQLMNRYGTLKDGCTKLGIHYRMVSERRFFRDFLIKTYNDFGYPDITDKNFFNSVEAIGIGGKKAKSNNIQVDPDLLYLTGLIGSDGWVLKDPRKRSAYGFSNSVQGMIDEYERMLRKNFPTRKVTVKPPSNPKYTSSDAVTYNFPLVQFNNNIGVKGRYVKDKTAYLPIFNLSKEHIAAFLSGMFDGDGSIDLDHQHITIAIFDPDRVKNGQLLMKKLGIDSKIKFSKQWTTPPYSDKKILSYQYSLEISGQKDLRKFIDIVGSRHPNKLKDMNEMMKKFQGKNQLTSKYNYAPQACGQLIKILRAKIGKTRSEIGNYYYVWQLEAGHKRTSIDNVRKIFENLSKYKELHNLNEFKILDKLTSSEFNLDIIKNVESIDDTELIEFTSNNRILSDNGIVLDE